MKNLTVLFLAVCTAGAMSASAADVKENWETHCTKCHGADGAGKTKMGEKLKVKDYTNVKVQADMKDEAMLKAIKGGKKEGDSIRMKAFGELLNDDEIKALVKHIRSFKK